MCFSAQASFLASGLLLAIGTVTLHSAWVSGQADKLPLAAAPLLFGVQQACEGIVWLGPSALTPVPDWGDSPPALRVAAALIYLFFAYAFWPVWMPLAAAALRPTSGWVGGLSRALPWVGLVPGVLLWLPLVRHPAAALPRHHGHTLLYPLAPWAQHLLPPLIGPALYAALIGMALVLVPSARVRIFALTLLLSFAVTEWANRQALTSLWCFASALLSVQVLGIVQQGPLSADPAPSGAALAPSES